MPFEYKDPEFPDGLDEAIGRSVRKYTEEEPEQYVLDISFSKFEKKLLTDLIEAEMKKYKVSPKDETYFTLEKILKKIR